MSPSTTVASVLSNAMPETGTTFFSTVTTQVAEYSPDFAVMVATPGLTAMTTPLSTTATAESELDHSTVLSVASSGVIVATRVMVSPSLTTTLSLSSFMPLTATTVSFCCSVIIRTYLPLVISEMVRGT